MSYYGGGSYKLVSVKEIKVTDDFNKLRKEQKKCQNEQTFESCMSEQMLDKIMENCGCIPFELFNSSITKAISLL